MTEAHYYPFGLALIGKWLTGGAEETKYHYNGKELNENFGLNWLDYGARWYDASIGRWNAVDPMAEDYSSYSSYGYVLNNPIRMIDPDGARTIFYDEEGNELYRSAYDGLDDAVTVISNNNLDFFNTIFPFLREVED